MKRNKNLAEIDENSDTNVRAKQRKLCCEKFVELTNTDEDLAISYLFETKYDLELALEKFKSEDHIVIDGYTIRCSQIKVRDLRVISWNLDGLDKIELKKRTDLAALTILNSKANIILLQELVEENKCEIVKYFADNYDIFIDDCDNEYYCGILIKKHPNIKIPENSFQIVTFDNTTMGRNLLKLTLRINDINVKIITGHLESTKEYGNIRKIQLEKAFQEMINDTDFSIFAGDLNLRDKELKEIGGIPTNIVDVWESTGSRPTARFTWDPKRNFNASQYCPVPVSTRFDRMYFYSKNGSNTIKPILFALDGLDKIPNGQRYASDHWAILGHFQIE